MSEPKMTERIKAQPVLWEITAESEAGHRTVFRVRASTEEEALAQLPDDVPDVVEARSLG